MTGSFPEQQAGLRYLTEGGQETEVMDTFGFELPEFALFPLLDNPRAVVELTGMYERYLETACANGFGALMGGLDIRASPDWATLLGYSLAGLEEMQLRSIDFLRGVARPYVDQLPALLIAGIVGPRSDTYTHDQSMTADQAQEYHSTQVDTLAVANVDLVEAMTFNSVAEAVGLARAAARVGLPASILFTLDSNHRLHSGPTLRQAIEAVDTECGDARPAFYGINCAHPLEFVPAIEPGDWFERVRCLRPNAHVAESVPLRNPGDPKPGDPAELGRLIGELAQRYPHIDTWGGCCGTWDRHLDAIARNVAPR